MTSALTPLDTLDALGLTEEAIARVLCEQAARTYAWHIYLNEARAIRALASPPPPHEAFRELP